MTGPRLAAWCLAAAAIAAPAALHARLSPLAPASALAQSPTRAFPNTVQEKPDEVLARAKQVYGEDGPKAALPLFERALALYLGAGDRRGEAVTTGLIGNCYKKFGDHQRALELLNRALVMERELGDRLEEGKTLSHLGLVYWEMARYPDAIDHLTQSIAIGRDLGDRQLEGSALNNLSLVFDEMGDYKRSLEQYHRVLEIYRGTSFERGESDALGNIGGVYLLLGQYREALRYYQQSLAIGERLRLKASVSQDLGNVALCHLGLGQTATAIQQFDRALLLAREAGLQKEEADWLKGKASALVQGGKYAAALHGYDEALKVYERARLQRELVEALNDRGLLSARLGDAASAEQNFRRAMEVSGSINHPRGEMTNLVSLGDLERRRNRLDEAASLYGRALAIAVRLNDRSSVARIRTALSLLARERNRLDEAMTEADTAVKDAQAIEALPLEADARIARGEATRVRGRFEDALLDFARASAAATQLGDPELTWRAAYGRAQALELLGRQDDAVASLREAVAQIEGVRSQLTEERFRASYREDKSHVYVSIVQLLLKLGRPEEAFVYAEKLRARDYRETVTKGTPPIRDESARQAEVARGQRVAQLRLALEQERAKPADQQRRAALDLFSSELFEAERAYEGSISALRAAEPAYADARALKVSSSAEIRQQLPPDAALVEFLVADNAVSVFVIRQGGIEAKTVPVRSVDLHAKVELLRDLILRESGNDWRAPAASLHELLVAPIEQAGWLAGISHLYVVPHGILHYLPFAVLPHGAASDARLLLNDYVVSYLPAAAALRTAPRASAAPSMLAMAPASTRLRYSRQEATTVARLFVNDPLLLVGPRATEGAFKSSAGRYSVLHLATHGYFNKFNPLLSGLELEPGGREDGRLEVHEILGLRLNANLVVLSACDTALGSGYFTEVPAGDDLVGLTRAFLFAGSAAVVASL
jgi:CHAT domain-containing protein